MSKSIKREPVDYEDLPPPEEILKQLMATEAEIQKSLTSLSTMINSPLQNLKMSFFQQLFDVTDGMDITIHIKRKNDKLTMSVLPQTVSKVQPVIITGTPEDLEADFFSAIAVPINSAKGLDVITAEFAASTAKAEEEAKAKEAKAKEKAAGKKVVKKGAAADDDDGEEDEDAPPDSKKKDEPKKEVAKAPEKPKAIAQQSMF